MSHVHVYVYIMIYGPASFPCVTIIYNIYAYIIIMYKLYTVLVYINYIHVYVII